MELTSPISWYSLPETVVMHIVALSCNKRALCEVNHQLFKYANKKNIDQLIEWPCVLRRNDHLNLMIKYARANNAHKMILAIKSAPLCKNKNAVNIISCFIDDKLINDCLPLYKDNQCDEYLKKLLPAIMFVYGCVEAHDNYKNKCIVQQHLRKKLSALQAAAYYKHVFIARLFLMQEKQGLVDFTITKGMSRRTPLHIAVINRDYDMVRLLCKNARHYIDAQSYSNNTPLYIAIKLSNKNYDEKFKIIKTLLDAGANPNIQTRMLQLTALMAAVSESLDNNIIKLILDKKALVNMQNQEGNTALIIATILNNYDVMELLCRYNADVNICNNNKETALYSAVTHNDYKMVRLLCKHNASVNIKNKRGLSPLIISVHSNNYALGAMNQRPRQGWESFGFILGGFEMATLLLEKGANPNMIYNDGDTAIICAARYNNIAMVKLLLDYGADPTIKNLNGENAYSFIVSDGIKQLLKEQKKLERSKKLEEPKKPENCIIS